MLKQPEYWEQKEDFILIIEEEWRGIVKKAKKISTSSTYSRRTYSLCKCALASERITMILVTYYNIIIKNQYFLKQWQKTLDAILEKGKESVLGKLRTIQLIEVDV